ncbi:MAG: hypothetical protein LBT89_11565 [Planctomycetaceae bacterium]|jgi:hypothetical protein|nr:hypothetical protein [Planctomycetaceae bacterium]
MTTKKTLIRLFLVSTVLMLSAAAGCSFCQTKRGHLVRCEWAIEHNRVPWIGCPPTSGCDDNEDGDDDDGRSCGLMKRLKNGKNGKRKGFRWHCGLRSECTAQRPCCKTLGCGMTVDPDDPQSFAQLGGAARACGLTPLCSPMKPCGLTPNCGKPAPVAFNPQALSAVNPAGRNNPFMNGINGGMGAINLSGNPAAQQALQMQQALQGTLVGRGIVPGVSTVSTGGIVAAIGVTSPAGTMTAAGVKLPNGTVNPNAVMRACTMSPNCTAAHPCGLVPGCGMAVPAASVSNNATVLASALMAQGSASGVMQAGTMVNPITNQPVSGLTMNGYPQAGYPPIGYSPTGYSPGHPRFDGNTPLNAEQEQEEEPSAEEEAIAERQAQMPVPRFYPVPSKPVFQRSEGLPGTQGTKRNQLPVPTIPAKTAKPANTVSRYQNDAAEPALSDAELHTALDEAYLQGVSAAMNEVEREITLQQQAANKKKLQQQIASQTQMVHRNIANIHKETEVITPFSSATSAVLNPQPQPQLPRLQVYSAPAVQRPLEDRLTGMFKSAVSGLNAGVNGLFAAQPQPAARTAKETKSVVSASKVSASKVASAPAKPGTYKSKALSGLAPEAEPLPLVQQAQYEREIPRP